MDNKELKNIDRELELTIMILKMGHSLKEEGEKKENYLISEVGSILVMLSRIMVNEEDMYGFSDLCSLFSAKIIMDDVSSGENGDDIPDNYLDIISNHDKDEIIKHLEQLRLDFKNGKNEN